jgi:hypothetical protein
MKEYIEGCGIKYDEFRYMLRRENMFVAGSAALSLYLKQEGIESGFEPNDLDIFVYSTSQVKDIIDTLMTKYQFTIQKYITSASSEEYYDNMALIDSVVNYKNSSGKIIQFIFIIQSDILHYIMSQFDMTCCRTWWHAYKEVFTTSDPGLTNKKKVFLVGPYSNKSVFEIENSKTITRIDKYKERGFIFVERKCPCIDKSDKRAFSDNYNWNNLTIEDIISLDNKPVKEYLEESSWNIVIKCGDNMYGFHRKTLMKMMDSKKSYNTILHKDICDTPFNQSILLSQLDFFKWSDYSIYELVYKYSVTNEYIKVKSLHDIKCYTVEGFEKGECIHHALAPINPKNPPTILKKPVEGLHLEIPPPEPLLFLDSSDVEDDGYPAMNLNIFGNNDF